MPFRPGRRFLICSLAILALLVVPSAASPAGQIVIFGTHAGSHLVVTTDGGKVNVHGRMGRARPIGCHLSRNRMNATCSMRGVAQIEIDTGPDGDFVHIADPMPFPVIAHLGAGSDKFIGNTERDTCYSEGARRNRCIGKSNNDVCITGRKNSDCVGGPGNDYCKTGAGSDGCWGGPGDDICYMGPGMDGCHGGPGDDILYGGANPDQLYGGAGYDYCDGGPGRGRSHACNIGPRQ
jgi:RTX calcium-binding nonapeptide repeat (4 copies)